MQNNQNREAILKIAAGGIVVFYVLMQLVIDPFFGAWKKQGVRIAELRQKVQSGDQLLGREKSLRARWEEMQKTDMLDDSSAGESDVYKALGRWTRDSRVMLNNFVPQWLHKTDDGYDAYECRATATGDQASLARLLYEIETDPLPTRVEECELSARDAKGKDLSLSLRFSFVRINGMGKNGR